MSGDYGDLEPEDAWNPEDRIANQVDNLLERLDLLDGERQPAGRWRAVIVDIEHRMRPYVERRDTGRLDERVELRVNQLMEDVAFVRERDDRGE